MTCVFEALGQSRTYDPRRNRTLVFGALTGSLIGVGSVLFTLWFAGAKLGRSPRSLSYALLALLFLAPPLVIGFLSGALETVWEGLAARALPSGELLPFPETPAAIESLEPPCAGSRSAMARPDPGTHSP